MLAHTRTLGYSVKEFLCNNGGEFDNKDVHEILHSNGITQRLTAPYTPEQNGASEREMRITIEMARTLKYSNPEDNPIENTLSQEDLSDSETDREEDAEPTSDRQLRNRSLLQKPKRFEDHIMEAESYLDDYNPETYE
ncbi:retrovirus-related pol polyprotein from transposon tnt 1-94 [Trichonephila clavipes]|nr:retrovirus-related pol polyprotein from transposon tnt 1-94 [Trichonephila clavipes]